jgi:hypothetical protein
MKNLYFPKLMKKNHFMHQCRLFILFLGFFLFWNPNSYAQTTCANALPIAIGACITGNIDVTDNSQSNPGYNTCNPGLGGMFRRERWYTFTVTNGPQEIQITATASNRNLALQLIRYNGSGNCNTVGNSTTVACVNADTNNNSAQTETLTETLPNGTYYIKVLNLRSDSNNNNNNQNMNLTSLCVKTNTTSCETAQNIVVGGACITNQTIDDIFQSGPAYTCGGTFQREAWYSFTITNGPQEVYIAAAAANQNLALQLLDGTCPGGLTSLLCRNVDTTNDSAQNESISTTLNNGTYYIKVLNVGTNNDMTLNSLCIRTNTTSCATAQNIVVDGTCMVNQPITDVLQSGPAYTCSGTFQRERWYMFTVTGGPQNIAIEAEASNQNLALQLLGGDCISSLTNIACKNDNTSTGAQHEIINAVLNDGTYYIKVLNVGPNADMTLTRLCVKTDQSNCTNATTVVVDGACLTGQTFTDSYFTAPNDCPGTPIRERWYTFEVTNGPQNISITAVANRNIALQLISGTCGSTLTTVTCADNFTADGTQTETITQVLANGIYYLKASNIGNIVTGSISSLCIKSDPATCYNAIAMNIGDCRTGDVINDNIPFAPASNCGYTFQREGWYTFEVTGGPQSIGVLATSTGQNLALEIYQGSCSGTLTQVGCVNGTTTNNSAQTETFTGVLNNGTYYIRVLHIGTSNADMTLSSLCIVSDSTSCTNAKPLTVNGPCLTNQAISDVFQSGPNYTCAGTFRSEGWYTFTVTNAPQSIVVAAAATANIGLQVYNGSCAGSLTSLTCVNTTNTNNAQTEHYTFLAATNGTYYVKVVNLSGANNINLDSLCVTTLNDNCASAIPLAVSPTVECITSANGSTQFATNSGIAITGCSGTADDDVWYSFVATFSNHIVTVSPGTMTNVAVQVFRGACGTLVNQGCANNNTASTEAVVLNGLTIGNTYHIRVYSSGNNTGQGTFTVCVTTNILCLPGTGTGTTSLSCPEITAGGLGLNGAPPIQVDCDEAVQCRTLEASFTPINQTTSYDVENIPFNPPYQFSCLANPISVNVDDVWSPRITLPFRFCFYGSDYNQVIVGSNGVISFNTNTPGQTFGGRSEWDFDNNLPSTNLFLNSIFGVYHDIDPSRGGTVGWELITLNSGCRALVAAWDNIPMYGCNNTKYTGMIVLYENTNIIEVYIKNKQVCYWNDGNAVVGIQNADGTQAVVPAGRNSLSPNWTVTNEAWRFVPSGDDTGTSITWYQGTNTSATGTVVGTSPTLEVCPTSTTTYSAKVDYKLCNGRTYSEVRSTTVTVIPQKVWTGATSTNWNANNNWLPLGIPTIDDCVLIPSGVTRYPIISTNTLHTGYAKNVRVENGATLTVNADRSLIVQNEINIAPTATVNINNTGSLVQINDNATNTGTIAMTRSTFVKKYDYVYWSSPVASFNASAISPATTAGFIYKWDPTIANTNGGQGNWVSGNQSMMPGIGYIVRVPNTITTTGSTFSTTFTGEPYNGVIQPAISRGTITSSLTGVNLVTITNIDDNLNLIGNPYPSAINATSFLAMNPTIYGNVKIWTHGTPPSATNDNPFYGDFTYNYSVNDYVTYNGIGSTPPGFNGYIGAGQSFFVTMLDGAAATQNVTFNNSLRHDGILSYNNSQFYRTGTNNDNAWGETNTNRIWLSLVQPNHVATSTLIGYTNDATYGIDRMYDAPHVVGNQFTFYSLIEDNNMVIQGRPLPFDNTDKVPLGIVIESTGIYTIAIHQVDGLFEEQDIYLEDTFTNTIHDLKVSPYAFTSQAGKFDNRFYLRYANETLGVDQPTAKPTLAYISDAKLYVQAGTGIKSVALYDVAGKLIQQLTNHTASTTLESDFSYANGVYLAMITLDNNQVVPIKLMNQ